MINDLSYNNLSPGSHAKVLVTCDSGKNEKCLGSFFREKRIITIQRNRTTNKDYCKFCQKTEEFTGRGNPNTKYIFDDHLLDTIDTPDKAYLLGWIASDGSISKNSIKISIRDYDVEILHKLRNIICKTLPVTETKNMVELTINSHTAVLACLQHLGLKTYGKKDAEIKYPSNILPELQIYFIRGFFDGDGSVSTRNRIPRVSIASNSIYMLQGIRDTLNIGSVYSSPSGPQWQTTNGQDAIHALNILYSDTNTPYLDRKYNKYAQICSWTKSLSGKETSIKFNTTNGLIKFNKSRADAVLPTITDIHASGIDLHILEKVKDFDSNVGLYTTGIKVTPPEGYYFILVGRSSISKSGYSLANGIGIIDENYIGEILVPLRKHTEQELVLPNRLVQLVLMPKINCEFVEVDSLEDTQRGTGGFGSTGQ